MDHTGNRNILKSLNEQRALATAELDAVCTDLDVMLVELVAEVHRYLGDFIFENVLRDIRKKSSQAGNWPPHKLDALHADLDAIVDKEIDRITDALRNNEEWYDTDVVFLEKGTQIWKTVHSIDAPVNKYLKKLGLGPARLRNWAWLGEHLDMLANDRYPPAKREFIEKQRHLKYLDSRIKEEEHAAGLFPALDEK